MLRRAGQAAAQRQPGWCLVALRHASDAAHGEVGIISGAPEHVFKRRVGIFAPSRTPSQQGLSQTIEGPGKGPGWKIEFENMKKWENPLMGWTSTADPVDTVARSCLNFSTREEAIAFAEKHGWEYEVREPNPRTTERSKRFAGYGDNFSVKRAGYPIGGLPSEQSGAGKRTMKK